MGVPVVPTIACGDPMIVFGADLRLLAWNEQAAELLGPDLEEAGRYCWEVVGGVDARGSIVCHEGCAIARALRSGRPVPETQLLVRGPGGRRLVNMATLSASCNGEAVFVHVLQPEVHRPPEDGERGGGGSGLTHRQLEVLGLLAEGLSTNAIAARLTVSHTTVRNHIRSLLGRLGCHSRLEAVAEARRRRLL